MKRILAALDFTAHADRAFARAVQLATQHDAELTHLPRFVGLMRTLRDLPSANLRGRGRIASYAIIRLRPH